MTRACGVADCPTPHDTGHDHPSPRHGSTVLLDFADPESRTMRTVRAERAAAPNASQPSPA